MVLVYHARSLPRHSLSEANKASAPGRESRCWILEVALKAMAQQVRLYWRPGFPPAFTLMNIRAGMRFLFLSDPRLRKDDKKGGALGLCHCEERSDAAIYNLI